MDAGADFEDAAADPQDDALLEALADDGSGDGGGDDDDASEASAPLEDMRQYDSAAQVTTLHSEDLAALLEKIEAYAEPAPAPADAPAAALTVGSELLLLLTEVNRTVQRLQTDLRRVFKFVTDHAEAYLPDLMQIEPNAVPYAKLMLMLRGRTDVAELRKELEDLPRTLKLPIATALHRAKPLGGAGLARVLKGCEDLIELDAMRAALLEFVQTQMAKVAPNTTAMVGSAVAATLTCEAGGLDALARMPSNVIRSLGKVRRGVSSVSGRDTIHAGALASCALMHPVAGAALKLRRKAAAIIANKVVLAVRTDNSGGAPDGSAGEKFAEEVRRLISELEKPRQIRNRDKALPKPGGKPGGGKRRGGAKMRRAREKWQPKEYEKAANRMAFGQLQNEDYMNDEETFRGHAASFKMAQPAEAAGAPPKKRKR